MSAAVSVVAQRAPTTLTVVRHRSQPAAATIARLTTAAVFTYPLVLALTTTPSGACAADGAARRPGQPLSDAMQRDNRVASVVTGVLLAVGLSAWAGFTW